MCVCVNVPQNLQFREIRELRFNSIKCADFNRFQYTQLPMPASRMQASAELLAASVCALKWLELSKASQ